jgi:hypothetical protein
VFIPGVNEGVKIPHREQISPLGARVKLRMGLRGRFLSTQFANYTLEAKKAIPFLITNTSLLIFL